MNSLGFTGTQKGMTGKQASVVARILVEAEPKHVHHGDCIGADEEFHILCTALVERPIIHIHPPSNPSKRAFREGDVIYEPKPYLKRNDDIVMLSDGLVATPSGYKEIAIGSGTWATIRRGRKKGIPIYIVYPSGKFEAENI